MSSKRYGFIDALRGFSIILMLLHHFAYDFVDFGYLPEFLLYNPIVDVLHLIFASVFVIISGACSSFSSRNIRRGIKILAAAAAVSVVTYFFDPVSFVKFGILHMLGSASIIYALLSKSKAFKKIQWYIWFALFVLTYNIMNITVDCPYLFPIGLKSPDFSSFDWFPLFPWLFIYFCGAKWGEYVTAGKLPKAIYDFSCPFLEKTGKLSLWIYLLHQPLLFGATYLIKAVFA